MARPLRVHIPGMLYHVTVRGNDKQCIFVDDGDHQIFLNLLAEALNRFGVGCLAYCLMWNHYHALLKVGALPLPRLFQQLNSTYCQGFNRRHGRVGHVLQGRFDARLVEDGGYARIALRYIALNPVEASYVTDPGEWRWSSYRFAVQGGPVPAFLVLDEVWRAFETADAAVGRARLQDFVSAGLQDTFPNPLLHGSEHLAKTAAPHLAPHAQTLDYIYAHRFAARPTLGSLFEAKFTQHELDETAFAAFYAHAYTLAEIGKVVTRDPSVVCRWIQRERQRLQAVQLPTNEDKCARNKI
jgi:putative transposase